MMRKVSWMLVGILCLALVLIYKRLLAMVEKVLGPADPHVATSLENYVMLLRKTNREVEAARMEAHAEAIRAMHSQKGLAI